MCLQSVVSSGLKPKVLEAYKRLLLHSYGHRHLLSLSNLEKLGLLSPQVSLNPVVVYIQPMQDIAQFMDFSYFQIFKY